VVKSTLFVRKSLMRETILNARRCQQRTDFHLDECQCSLRMVREPPAGHPHRARLHCGDRQPAANFAGRQYRVASDQIMSEIPAGVLEKAEDPQECAIRELQEEIGYKPGKIESLGGFYTAPATPMNSSIFIWRPT